MNHLLDDDDDLIPRRERELTLSTGSILAIFFGLVLICGLFFAFGYNLGSKSHPPQVAAATDDTPSSSTSANFSNFKPSAGSPAGSSNTTAVTANATPVTIPPPSKQPAPTPAATKPEPAPANDPPAPHPTPVNLGHPSPASDPAASLAGVFVVQIAAVSHQEDANLLVNALRGKGYSVAAHTEPQDKLFHIQVGPFTNRREADAMRQRLLADGYNALVK